MSKQSPTLERRYGWIPQLPDKRDIMYAPRPKTLKALPPRVDLRPQCPDVYDQGQLGSCTGNGIAFVHQFDQMKQKQKAFPPSRLAIYYGERKIEGTIMSDAGAIIRDGIKVIAKEGVADEKLWPYVVSKFTKSPPASYYVEAEKHQSIKYKAVAGITEQLCACLAEGFPIVFGFTVYESFESDAVAKSGVMPMPKKGERTLGGHCVAFVGYDLAKKVFICRNSWGSGWGDKGHFTMPFAFAEKNASDFWQVSVVE